MGKLKDLILSGCSRLGKFPEIEMHMYSLVSLNLKQSGIEIVPSSVGKYCTNLRYLDFRSCNNLKIIEGNFRSLKGLKELHLDNCERLGKLADDFFNEECCLELVSLSFRDSISITNLMSCIGLRCFQQDLVGWKLPHFPRFLTTLSLRFCNLVDGDIPSNICELSNLKRLDLKGNNFVRLRSILSQLNGLKYLDLSHGNAVENYFMSLRLGTPHSQTTGHTWDSTKFTLLLPKRWYKDFSGFLICVDEPLYGRNRLIINQETHVHYQRDHWEEFDKTPQFDTYKMVGYVSLGSLRHTSWWNSSYTRITFELMRTANIKVGLVPRKSKRGSTERAEDANAEFSDKEVDGNKTFEIKHDSKSYLEIEWFHNSL
nr:hypothetical protein [Tanacetum cinerariifolium]